MLRVVRRRPTALQRSIATTNTAFELSARKSQQPVYKQPVGYEKHLCVLYTTFTSIGVAITPLLMHKIVEIII